MLTGDYSFTKHVMKHSAASGCMNQRHAAYSHAADGDGGTGALGEGGRALCRTGRCSDVVDRHIDLKGRRRQVRKTKQCQHDFNVK